MSHILVLTSKIWWLQRYWNHFIGVRGPMESLESCEFLTQSPHAALRTEYAHQDLKKSEEVCWYHKKSQVWPRTLFMPSSDPSKRLKISGNLIVNCSGFAWLVRDTVIGLLEYWRQHSANILIVACRTANPTSYLRCVVGSASLLCSTAIFWRLAISGVQRVVPVSADSDGRANIKTCWRTSFVLACASWHGLTRCELSWSASNRMSFHLRAWIVSWWHDTAGRKHRLADFERVTSRSITRGGSYRRGGIPGQWRGSQTLLFEFTASQVHGRDLCEPARTTKSEHDGSSGMRAYNRTHRLPHPPLSRLPPRRLAQGCPGGLLIFSRHAHAWDLLTWTVQCTARVTVGTCTSKALRLFRAFSSSLCVGDLRDYEKLLALVWLTSLKYRALPTERVLTEFSFTSSSRAHVGFLDRISSACPSSLWSAAWRYVISRVGGGWGGLLLFVFVFRLCCLPSALVASSFSLSVVRYLGVRGGAQV